MLKTTRNKLKEKGIESIYDLNPQKIKPLIEREELVVEGEAEALPLNSIPRGFTDDQHFQRNKQLPKAPTKEQFLKGMVRGFNFYLNAEFFSPHYTTEELNPIGPKMKFNLYFAEKIRENRQKATIFSPEISRVDSFLIKNHKFVCSFQSKIASIWTDKTLRPLVVMGVSMLFSLFFIKLSMLL